MNKTEFIALLAGRLESSQAQASRTLEAVLETMTDVFKSKDALTLPGFAKLGVKERAARSARNPLTGKTIEVSAKNVPFVRFSSKIKNLLNGSSSAIDSKKGKAQKDK